MNRVQVACYSLLASAFLLAGLLVYGINVKFDGQVSQPAYGEMVIAQRGFSMMTARTRSDEESLFVMHNQTGNLLIYTTDLQRRRLELQRVASVRAAFERLAGD